MANLNLKAVITAEDKASSTVKSFSSNLSALGKGAVGAATSLLKIGTVAGTALTAAGGFAIKSASDVQMLRTNLDTLTGSAEKGSAMFKKLYDMASKTPFETTDLVKSTGTLLAFGVAQEKILPTLQMLGDVSLGNKVKFEALSLAYAQVMSTGRLMGQDLLQMVNQGFNPLQIISEKTGKSMSVLKDEMSKGAISADMVTEAFKTATSEGGRFYGGMDKGAKTLQGTMSTLKDGAMTLVRSLVGLSETGDVVKGGLFDKVTIAVNGLNQSLPQIIQHIFDMVTWFTSLKDTVVAFFTENQIGIIILETFKTLIQNIVDQAKNLWGIILQNKEMFKELGVAILFIVGGALALFLAALNAIIWTIGKVIQLLALIREVSKEVGQAVLTVFEFIGSAIKRYLNGVIGNINMLIKGINKIPGVNIGLIPQFASGGIMQEDGLAFLHKGETVIPKGSVTNNNGVTVNIYGGMNPQGMNPYEIAQTIDRQIQLSRQGAY